MRLIDFVLAIIGGIIIFALPPHIYLYKKYHYICPKCSTSFKPTFWQSFAGINRNERRMLKCPYCNKRQWVTTMKDSKS